MTQEWIPNINGDSYGVDGYGTGPYGGTQVYDLEQTSRSDRSRKSEQWETCTRCGFTFPISQMRLQAGDGGVVKVCMSTCYDEPSLNDLRPDRLPQEKPYVFVDEGGPTSG